MTPESQPRSQPKTEPRTQPPSRPKSADQAQPQAPSRPRAEPGRGGARPRGRVPRNTLSTELIVDTALRLLDAKGVDAFSMRALAEELGVGTMALYTYFRSKDELFQAARKQVIEGYCPPVAEGAWYEQVRDLCMAFYQLLTERPAVLRLLAVRSADETDVADTASTALERILAQLRTAGLDRIEAARGYLALLQYTLGAALRHVHACVEDEDGRLERVRSVWAGLSAEAHPTIMDLMPELLEARQESAQQYASGLDLLLAGLRQQVAAAQHRTQPPAQRSAPG
jgi:AcrR family transcriptional regulator